MSCWRDGRLEKTGAGSAAVFTPGMSVEIMMSNTCGLVGIKISEHEMRQQIEAMLDRPVRKPVTFARRLNLNTRASRNWLALVRILARETGRPDGVLAHQLAIENLQQQLLEGLLLIQPHNYAEALAKDEHAANLAVVNRAIDLMHAYPQIAWTTVQLATATGVSPRALQKTFQRSGQPPPMTYLRRLRLDRVRAELAIGSPTTETVTAAGSRWGFLHMGRFAEQYRELFGETPSQTLRARQ